MNSFFIFSTVMGSAGLSVIYVLCLFVVCMRQDQDRNENFGNLGATNNNNRSLQGSSRPLAINYESSSSSLNNYRQEIQPLILQFSSSSSSINNDSHITSRWCSVGWFSFGPYPWRKKYSELQICRTFEKPISNLEKLWIIWSPMKIIIDLKLNPWFCNYNCFLA